jgi:hypothetical protein
MSLDLASKIVTVLDCGIEDLLEFLRVEYLNPQKLSNNRQIRQCP